MVLQKREDIDLVKTINDIALAAKKAGLELRLNEHIEKGKYEANYYTYANLANKFDGSEDEQQVLMYVYSQGEDDYLEEFDWIRKDGNLIQSINIEDISGCEEIMLDFLYEYMSLNQDVLFWDEYEWAYSYSDIIKIKNSEFDKEWCYKKPL